MADITKGPYVFPNSNNNMQFINGFDILATVPIDGRTIVDTLTQRNSLTFVYRGLEIWVRDEQKRYRFIGALNPASGVADPAVDHPGGQPTQSTQWFEVSQTGRNGYKGAFAATGPFPGLSLPPIDKVAGDFYIVNVAGSAVINSGTGVPATVLALGDEVMWSGTSWQLIPNTIDTRLPDIYSTNIIDFTAAVKNLVRLNAITIHNQSDPYKLGDVVVDVVQLAGGVATTSGTSQDANVTKKSVTLYKALQDVVAGGLLGDSSQWLMIASNNYDYLTNRLKIDNSTGLGSVLTTPLNNGLGVLLDAKEIDRRILENGGGSVQGVLNGGFSDTDFGPLGIAMYP